MDLHIFPENNHKIVVLVHKYTQQVQRLINVLYRIVSHALTKYIVQNVTSIIIYRTM